MSLRKTVSLVGAVAVGAALALWLPGAPAQSDPILPLPSPSLPLPSVDPSDPLPDLPDPPDDDPSAPGGIDPVDPGDGSSDSDGSGKKSGDSRSSRPRPADPDDPGGDLYPHPPFAPVNGNPSAALLQRLYDAQAEQRELRNRIDTTEAALERAEAAVEDAKSELTAARRTYAAVTDGVRDSVREAYKSGAPYGVYTAMASPGPGVIRTGPSGRLSAATSASERIDYLADQLAGAVDERDALAASLTDLKRRLRQANAVVDRHRAQVKELAGAPDGGLPAGYTGGALLWPVRGSVTSEYGNRYDPYYHSWQLHAGIDIAAPSGTRTHASAPGRVVRAGEFGGYGNYVCIAHGQVRGQQLTTCYGHLSRILVREGQSVRAARTIGLVGTTGASTGPHLHFEVRLGGRPTDPRLWL